MVKVSVMKKTLVLSFLLPAGIFLSSGISESPQKTSTRIDKRSGDPDDPVGTVYIIINKSSYKLSVYDDLGWFATYPVVFGNNSLADKKMEGDRNTPEGIFRIVSKRIHEKWHRFLAIDYPNEESKSKFLQRKAKGEIPAHARIGGSIGIHGTWPREDFVIDRLNNWTLGCISMKRADVKELYDYTPVGTKVIIRK
jgi:murein L,D-transpeptidase YafK